jgi:hypothetical protein
MNGTTRLLVSMLIGAAILPLAGLQFVALMQSDMRDGGPFLPIELEFTAWAIGGATLGLIIELCRRADAKR